MTTADLWHFLYALASMVVTAATPILLVKLNAWLKAKALSDAADDLDQALVHGLGLVLDAIKAAGNTSSAVATKTAAVANAASLVMKLAPNAATRLNVTHEDVVDLINAGVTKATTPVNVATKMLLAPTLESKE